MAAKFLILQASSRDCSDLWWQGSSLSVELKSFGALQSLSSWVLEHRPPVWALRAVASVEGCYQAHTYSPIDGTRWNPLPRLLDLELHNMQVDTWALLEHTKLTRLVLKDLRGAPGEAPSPLQPLCDYQPNLAALPRLRELRLVRCGLPDLPSGLSALLRLKVLDLEGNGSLLEGNGSLGEEQSLELLSVLPALTWLSLAGCGLRSVPATLAVMIQLSCLDLSENPLDGWGFQHLPSLVHLTCLNLNHTWCYYGPWLPIGLSSRLRHLGLQGMPFKALPPVLTTLSNLHSLDLGGATHLGSSHSLRPAREGALCIEAAAVHLPQLATLRVNLVGRELQHLKARLGRRGATIQISC
ncbi:hypothetical protein N2152v2_004359 [Parachlorella kessleri]